MPEPKTHLTFGVEDPQPEMVAGGPEHLKMVLDLVRAELDKVEPSLTGTLMEQAAELWARVERTRACLGLLASITPPHLLERYRRIGREQGILGPDWSPEPVSRKTVENVIRAAREVDALLGGDQGRWTFDGRRVTDDASIPLLSLHDYLNDVERETSGTL